MDKAEILRKTILLLNQMVEDGDSRTEQPEQLVKESLAVLETDRGIVLVCGGIGRGESRAVDSALLANSETLIIDDINKLQSIILSGRRSGKEQSIREIADMMKLEVPMDESLEVIDHSHILPDRIGKKNSKPHHNRHQMRANRKSKW